MRKPTSDELRLIEYLANKADYDLSADFREHIYVVPIPPILEGELTPLKIIFDNLILEKQSYLMSRHHF